MNPFQPKSQILIRSPFGKALAISIALCFLVLFSAPVPGYSQEEAETRPADSYEKLKIFSEILSLVETSYVESVDSEQLIDGAIRGLVKTLDPHTSYLPPVSYKDMQVETSGKFGGLGIEISMRKGVLTVVSPIEDTPAYKAGIKAGDKIIKIEDESTLDMTLSDAVTRLRGETGSPVTITVYREKEEAPIDFTIVRDIIKVRSVRHKVYNSDIGYIKIRNFTKTTAGDLDTALGDLENQGITKLVLDLRNNPGGLLNQAVEVTDRFLEKESLIVYTKGRSEDQNMRFTTHDTVKRVKYPMIIMVNSGSASASEIVAGALQDLGRAVVLGTPTFGKGSVQTIIPLSDGSALRLTTARYYTPSGRVIQENGIVPDIVVESKPVVEEESVKNKKEESESKKRIRRFLRERDLKKHLKGKSSLENGEEDSEIEKEAEDAEEAEFSEDLEKDNQLQQAINLLAGWDIMRDSLKKIRVQQQVNITQHSDPDHVMR